MCGGTKAPPLRRSMATGGGRKRPVAYKEAGGAPWASLEGVAASMALPEAVNQPST